MRAGRSSSQISEHLKATLRRRSITPLCGTLNSVSVEDRTGSDVLHGDFKTPPFCDTLGDNYRPRRTLSLTLCHNSTQRQRRFTAGQRIAVDRLRGTKGETCGTGEKYCEEAGDVL